MEIKLSHIAIACPDIQILAEKLEKLGLRESERHEVPSERVSASMIPVKISKHFRIELLEPTGEDSPIAKFLQKRAKGGIHHICFEVSGLDDWNQRLTVAGIEVLAPGIRKGARGRVLFIHPRSMGGTLVELEEIS